MPRRPEQRSGGGFTLLEVLVAMVIVALGMLAVFGQLNQAASTATRLRDKTFAEWIALNQLTLARIQGDFPAVGSQSNDTEMGYGKWHYVVDVSETGVADLRRVDVSVSLADAPDHPVIKVSGFIARRPQVQQVPGAAAGGGWEPLNVGAGQPARATP